MIHVGWGYGIDVQPRNYTVGKITKVKDKATGEETEAINGSNASYYSSLDKAIIGLEKKIRNNKMEGYDGSLADALEKVRQIDDRFAELVMAAIPELEVRKREL